MRGWAKSEGVVARVVCPGSAARTRPNAEDGADDWADDNASALAPRLIAALRDAPPLWAAEPRGARAPRMGTGRV